MYGFKQEDYAQTLYIPSKPGSAGSEQKTMISTGKPSSAYKTINSS
jgi:hypothetical protein